MITECVFYLVTPHFVVMPGTNPAMTVEGAHGPTRKVKSPCVRWVSTESTRQITL